MDSAYQTSEWLINQAYASLCEFAQQRLSGHLTRTTYHAVELGAVQNHAHSGQHHKHVHSAGNAPERRLHI